MDKAQVSELQAQSVAQITEQLPGLDREALIELAALEAQHATPRSTLQSAIDKQLAELDEKPDDEKPAAPAAKPAAPEKIATTDYRHPDYAGPLDGEQAAWRVLNIKPVAKVRLK